MSTKLIHRDIIQSNLEVGTMLKLSLFSVGILSNVHTSVML
uniref:Uncharacterized protein n=1 Tax=Zea mays TaxID=4577 RepID=C4J8H3_MAIZE|nr:unknown [Zea mays]